MSRALVTGHGSSSSCAFTVDPWPGASCAHRTQPPRPPAEQAALSPLLPTEEPDVQGFPSRTGLAGGAGGLTGLAGGVGGSRAVLGAGPTSRVVLGRTGFAVVSGAGLAGGVGGAGPASRAVSGACPAPGQVVWGQSPCSSLRGST